MDPININQGMGNVGLDNRDHEVNVNKKDDGVIAKGIGLFKKAWLHITGKAGNVHSQQLTNLRAQVKQGFGNDGLRNLETILQKKGWNSDTSTKLFSSSELQNIMGKVQMEQEVDQSAKGLMDKIHQDPAIMFDDQVLSEILHSFGEARFTQENVNFLRDMAGIPKEARGRDVETDDLQNIVQQYIGSEAPEYVNLDDKTRSAPILKANDELTEALQSGDRDKIDQAKDKLLTLLKGGRDEIMTMTMQNLTGEHGKAFDARVREIATQQIMDEVFMARLELSGLAPSR